MRRDAFNFGHSAQRNLPFWMQCAAVLCLFLILGASTAEVSHIHANQVQSGTPDHCPLCVAIHSALPTPLHSAQAPEFRSRSLLSTRSEHQWSRIFNHEVSDRAPPQIS